MAKGSRNEKLDRLAEEVYWKLRPIPPPLKFSVDSSIRTSYVNLANGTVALSTEALKSPYVREFLAHEFKHVSCDGIPYTFYYSKRHEALLRAHYKYAPRDVLNLVYDIVVDQKIARLGFNVRGFQEYVVSFSPVNNPDDRWGRVNGLYRVLIGAKVDGIDPPLEVREAAEFLACSDKPWKCEKEILVLAEYFYTNLKDSSPSANPLCGEIMFDVPRDKVEEVVEIGVELQLSPQDIKELVGGEYDVDAALSNIARKKIWQNILAFKDLLGSDG
ncbi:MAG: hypothetical protein ACPL07_02245, partial [Candidatus Bathyarchaeia archaeon]